MFRLSTRAAVTVGIVFVLGAIALQHPAAQAPQDGGVVALVGVRIIDGTGAPAVAQGTILMTNGRITAAGPSASVQVPPGATTIVELKGKTVMPGLVNAHGHVQALSEGVPAREDLIRRLRMYASYGVTTVVSLGQSPKDELEVIALRDEQDRIALDRARVYTSGDSVRRQKTPEEARQTVNRRADMKVDRIKFHMEGGANAMSPETYGALIDQAHTRGLRVAAHIFTLAEAKGVLDKGIDVIAHSVRDQDVDQAFIGEMKRRNIGYIPTLTREVSVFAYETTPAFFTDPFFLRGASLYGEAVKELSDPARQQKVRADAQAQAIKKALVQANRNVKLLSDAGVTIALGTDSGADGGRWQGYFEEVELEMLVQAGLTPMQAIVAATSAAARVSRLDHVGTIAPGKAADLLVLDANPVQDIKNLRQIHSVWIGGRRIGITGTN